jgi:hypothetical protein
MSVGEIGVAQVDFRKMRLVAAGALEAGADARGAAEVRLLAFGAVEHGSAQFRAAVVGIHHCGWIPAALITFAHFVISVFM